MECEAAPDRRYRRTTDPEAEEILKKAMNEASDKGLSALKAAEKTGISYAQARALMPVLFKKTGSGGQTVYFPKRRSAKSKS